MFRVRKVGHRKSHCVQAASTASFQTSLRLYGTAEMVANVLHHLPTVKDVKFLLAHAPSLFPSSPEEVNGEKIWRELNRLRDDLRRRHKAAAATLATALRDRYPDAEESQVRSCAPNSMPVCSARQWIKPRVVFATEVGLRSCCTQLFPPLCSYPADCGYRLERYKDAQAYRTHTGDSYSG